METLTCVLHNNNNKNQKTGTFHTFYKRFKMSGSLLNQLSFQTSQIHISSSFLDNNNLDNVQKKLNAKCECYLTLKLIRDLIEECTRDQSDLNKNLKLLVKNHLLHASCAHIAPFPIKPPNSLTYVEGRQLSQEIQHRLIRKLNEINPFLCEDLHEKPPIQLIPDNTLTIERKQNLLDAQKEYMDKARKLTQILSKITKTRLTTIPQMAEKKVQHAELTTELNHLKMQLTKNKIRIDIFTETNKSLEAYKKLITDIQAQRTEYEKEIKTLENLKNRYKQISCVEYNKILTSYLQYKKSLEKKKMIYECRL